MKITHKQIITFEAFLFSTMLILLSILCRLPALEVFIAGVIPAASIIIITTMYRWVT